MAPYDSDDSLDDEQDYTETDVLLGYASKESNGETISRLGGRPEWIDPSQPPSFDLAKCKVCSAPLVLLLQLNGDLPDRFPGHERRLYVFACRNKKCRRRDGSVRAIRATRIEAGAAAKAKERREREERERAEKEKAEKERKEKEKGLGEALFGVQGKSLAGGQGNVNPFSSGANASSAGANPFAANPFSSTSSSAPAPTPQQPPPPAAAAATAAENKATETAAKDLPKTFAETLSLNNPQTPSGPPPPPTPWPAEAELPPAYPVSYLAEAEYETLDPVQPQQPQQNIQTTTNFDEGTTSGGKESDNFESTIDSTFQRFADRLAQNPEQCIRYEFGGAPLLYAKTDAVGGRLLSGAIPRCGACGLDRAFEVQLVPGAIAALEDGDADADLLLEGMDWGTVIVGVCAGDCVPRGTGDGEVGYVEEWVGVQWEELTARR